MEKQLLLKIVRIRRKLMAEGLSKKDHMLMEICLEPFERWIKHFGVAKITDKGCRVMIINHYAKIRKIIPGAGSNAHQSIINQLNLIVNEESIHYLRA